MGISTEQRLYRNLTPSQLYEHALRRGEGVVTNSGPFAAVTSPHTGRSPNDKFLVQEPDSTDRIWWGKVNQPIAPEQFERLKADVETHLSGQELFVRDVYACADPNFRLPLRFITPNAWQALFVYNMFLRPADGELSRFAPGFEVLHAPEFHADPRVHGTKSGTFIIVSFAQRTILIGGTRYAGELKKSIFTILNYLLPLKGVLSMHCSANVGEQGDTALFFGLSGTGKTTLSADPHRFLVGDDEHGWSDDGIFNFEGGCYAKAINLSADGEPEIYRTTQMFGTILENTVRGVKEPQATFSACFGAVFLVWHPSRYAQMLGSLLEKHNAQVWLVNTGWTGGAYGTGERMKLGHTRAMIRAALSGELTGVPT